MTASREALIAHVNKSPEAVAIHDKSAWLDIFAEYALVEDPVGSTPHVNGVFDATDKHRGNGPIARFYETFIAPNNIVFDVDQDVVCGMHVVRDLTVNLVMGGKVKVQVPMHLLYELVEQRGELKIQRLAAHWELVPMVKLLFSQGFAAVPIMLGLSARMLRNQGLFGAMGFSKGMNLVGNRGKLVVQEFAHALKTDNQQALQELFTDDALIEFPANSQGVSFSEAKSKLPGELQFGKTLVCGYAVTCSFEYQSENGDNKKGVAIFEFATRHKRIHRAKFYFE